MSCSVHDAMTNVSRPTVPCVTSVEIYSQIKLSPDCHDAANKLHDKSSQAGPRLVNRLNDRLDREGYRRGVRVAPGVEALECPPPPPTSQGQVD